MLQSVLAAPDAVAWPWALSVVVSFWSPSVRTSFDRPEEPSRGPRRCETWWQDSACSEAAKFKKHGELAAHDPERVARLVQNTVARSMAAWQAHARERPLRNERRTRVETHVSTLALLRD